MESLKLKPHVPDEVETQLKHSFNFIAVIITQTIHK